MRTDPVDEAIRRTFPTGLLHEPVLDFEQFRHTREQVCVIAELLGKRFGLQAEYTWGEAIERQGMSEQRRYVEFTATLPPDPRPYDWIGGENAPRLKYIADIGCSVTLWRVNFSFVYPVWDSCFNFWRASDSRIGYLDVDFSYEPLAEHWKQVVAAAKELARERGFSYLEREEAIREVPFVQCEVFDVGSDADLADEEDYDFDAPLPLKNCYVRQCLFSEIP